MYNFHVIKQTAYKQAV